MLYSILGLLLTAGWLLLGLSAAWQFLSGARRDGLGPALRRLTTKQFVLPFVLLAGLSLVKASLVFVQPTHMGVVVSLPSPDGVRDQRLESGLNWVWPVIEKPLLYPRYWQTYTMSDRLFEGQHPDSDAIKTRTLDNQEVSIDISVIFRIDPEQVIDVHRGWQDRYAEELLRPAVRAILRREVSGFTVGEVNSTERNTLAERLDSELKKIALENGLVVNKALLRNIAFTDEYASAVEQKQVALEGRERRQHEAQQIANLARGKASEIEIVAQAEAEAIKIKAEARAEARLIQARAEARALELVAGALQGKQDLLTYRYITKLSPTVQAVVLPNDMPLIFPLPGMRPPPVPAMRPAAADGRTVSLESHSPGDR